MLLLSIHGLSRSVSSGLWQLGQAGAHRKRTSALHTNTRISLVRLHIHGWMDTGSRRRGGRWEGGGGLEAFVGPSCCAVPVLRIVPVRRVLRFGSRFGSFRLLVCWVYCTVLYCPTFCLEGRRRNPQTLWTSYTVFVRLYVCVCVCGFGVRTGHTYMHGGGDYKCGSEPLSVLSLTVLCCVPFGLVVRG